MKILFKHARIHVGTILVKSLYRSEYHLALGDA